MKSMMFVWDNMGDEINAKMQIEFIWHSQFKKRNTDMETWFHFPNLYKQK